MRSSNLASSVSVVILLAAAIVEASHGHKAAHEALRALRRRHRHSRELQSPANETLEKRGTTCAFPTGLGLVPVTPGSSNGGWAFAPDQYCTPGRYCAYACPPGQVSMQWDPAATSYSYPVSRNGGLLCHDDGSVSKPFPDKPYCQATASNIGVQNRCTDSVAFCQTVLPGDEDMLIPTVVSDYAALAVPDPSYWVSTAAHYYINAPGVSGPDGCKWGSVSQPVGNWAPYVAGANADANGLTFIKLGWNPVYLETATPFRNTMPDFGVRIECPDNNCNGLPCAIDPTKNNVNSMLGAATDGAGGGAFCVVTVPKGSKANFVVFKPGQDTEKAAGKFYQSTTTSQAPSTTAAVTSTSTTKSVVLGSALTTHAANSTTTTKGLQTDQAYYQLFASSSAYASTTGSHVARVQTSAPTPSSKQNAASSFQISTSLLLLAFGTLLI